MPGCDASVEQAEAGLSGKRRASQYHGQWWPLGTPRDLLACGEGSWERMGNAVGWPGGRDRVQNPFTGWSLQGGCWCGWKGSIKAAEVDVPLCKT